jgi:hypothetical protein
MNASASKIETTINNLQCPSCKQKARILITEPNIVIQYCCYEFKEEVNKALSRH